jgi:outer membrane biosynthesis protein TonB
MTDEGGALAPAPATKAADETPPARWRFASGIVAGGLAVSAAIHVALVGAVLVMGAQGRPPAPVKAVPVDVVTPDELAEMTEKAKAQETSPPSSAATPSQAEQTPQAPPQQTPQAQPQQAQPQPTPTPPSQSASPPPSPPASPPSAPTLDAFAPPLPSSAAPTASEPPPPPTPSTGEAAQVAQMLGLPTPVAGVSGGPPSQFKANLTSDEIAGFAAHVQSCWTALPGTAKSSNLTVFIRVRLRPDGSLAGNPEPLGGSASMQAIALLKNSIETLKHCPAYTTLPADKYKEWSVLDLHFTPNGISTATPVAGNRR